VVNPRGLCCALIAAPRPRHPRADVRGSGSRPTKNPFGVR
jgi:hypothetical protein